MINQWMQARNYFRTEAAFEHFKAGKFAWVAGRAHPEASLESILLVATYMSWLFMLDDLCDEASLGRDPDRLKAQYAELIEHMRHPRPLLGNESPVVAGLAELWERMLVRAVPGWAERFIRTFEDYTRGCLWEAENRVRNRIPSVAEYVEQRPYTSALYIFFDLIELVEQVSLPAGLQGYVHALKVRANDGVAWFNDMVSLEKEVRAGDVHNLIIVLQHEHGLSAQAAMHMAGQLFSARMREYVELERRLQSSGVAICMPLQRYLRGLRCWVRGNMDWSYETGRYGRALVPPSLKRAAS
jgi:Terpene synthase family 2, C-terminal metal binding